jgi:hypothetical protein
MTRNVSHFVEEEWADFLNQLVSKEQANNMQSHLDLKCKSCTAEFAIWQKVYAAAQRESQYEAPEWAVRYVQNAFAIAATKTEEAERAFQIPRLVFDSFLQPALAGVRSGGTALRQLRYRADNIGLELRLEPEKGSERVNITGQVSRIAGQGEGLSGINILVTSTGGKISETCTNRFGEFQLSFTPERDSRFTFAIDGKALSIPLDITETRH